MTRDSFRFCMHCGALRRYHPDMKLRKVNEGHSKCTKCGYPSLCASGTECGMQTMLPDVLYMMGIKQKTC